ncbi:MAG: pilin [bacterium]
MKKIVKHLLGLMAIVVLFAPVLSVHAISKDTMFGGSSIKSNTVGAIGLAEYDENKNDPRIIIANVIKFMLGFLGIIAVIIILFAGFKWMTAGGDSKKIDEAKDLMKNGVMGLIIILSSWAIANFVIDQLLNVTGNGA